MNLTYVRSPSGYAEALLPPQPALEHTAHATDGYTTPVSAAGRPHPEYGSTEAIARDGLVTAVSSTSAGGWVGAPPFNSHRISDLVPAPAPAPSEDMTPFHRRMFQRLWSQVASPMKNEWATETQGHKVDLTPQLAAMPPGLGTAWSVRGNSFRLQPQPWDAQIYVGGEV